MSKEWHACFDFYLNRDTEYKNERFTIFYDFLKQQLAVTKQELEKSNVPNDPNRNNAILILESLIQDFQKCNKIVDKINVIEQLFNHSTLLLKNQHLQEEINKNGFALTNVDIKQYNKRLVRAAIKELTNRIFKAIENTDNNSKRLNNINSNNYGYYDTDEDDHKYDMFQYEMFETLIAKIFLINLKNKHSLKSLEEIKNYFQNEMSLSELIYAGILDANKKRTTLEIDLKIPPSKRLHRIGTISFDLNKHGKHK